MIRKLLLLVTLLAGSLSAQRAGAVSIRQIGPGTGRVWKFGHLPRDWRRDALLEAVQFPPRSMTGQRITACVFGTLASSQPIPIDCGRMVPNWVFPLITLADGPNEKESVRFQFVVPWAKLPLGTVLYAQVVAIPTEPGELCAQGMQTSPVLRIRFQ